LTNIWAWLDSHRSDIATLRERIISIRDMKALPPRRKIEELNLSTRAFNTLKSYDINYIDEIGNDASLLRMHDFGRRSLKEVRDALAQLERGLVPQPPAGKSKNLARGANLLAAHQSGLTLQQIGDREGISRERVRQLIKSYETDAMAEDAADHSPQR
jgi:hypothetical protein